MQSSLLNANPSSFCRSLCLFLRGDLFKRLGLPAERPAPGGRIAAISRQIFSTLSDPRISLNATPFDAIERAESESVVSFSIASVVAAPSAFFFFFSRRRLRPLPPGSCRVPPRPSADRSPSFFFSSHHLFGKHRYPMQSDALNPNPSRFLRSGFFFFFRSTGTELSWPEDRHHLPPAKTCNRRLPVLAFGSWPGDRRHLPATKTRNLDFFLYFGPCFNFFCFFFFQISFLPSDPLVTVKNWSGSRGSRSSNRKRKKKMHFSHRKSQNNFSNRFFSLFSDLCSKFDFVFSPFKSAPQLFLIFLARRSPPSSARLWRPRSATLISLGPGIATNSRPFPSKEKH